MAFDYSSLTISYTGNILDNITKTNITDVRYAGEHSDAHPLPYRVWRSRGHVQRQALYPASEVCHDSGGAECLWSVRSYVRAVTLYTG